MCGTFFLSGCGFKDAKPEPYQVKLEMWGVFDDSDAYNEIISQYRALNPYVGDITYRKLPVETYKEDLLDALAAGKGPDIFMIRNSWRETFEDKIALAPEYMLNEKQFRDAFVDVAATDFVDEGKIYGAPLSVDSLALYYNKDIFNAAGISRPPVTWEELGDILGRLNFIDQFGNITQSAIALGTAYNINRSTDILSALMLQKKGDISRQNDGKNISLSDQRSREAFDFYTQFSRLNSASYSWNPRLHYSIDAFYEGTLAMMINYSWQYPAIKQKNAKLNFGIAPLPQFVGEQPENVANYWGLVVSKNKVKSDAKQATASAAPKVDPEKENFLRVHESWQFLNFFTFPHTNNTMTFRNGLSGTTKDLALPFDPAKKYLAKTLKPAARRDLVEEQKNDVVLSSFAAGNLIAKNWYQGNMEGVEAILAEAIETVSSGQKSLHEALDTASKRINVLKR